MYISKIELENIKCFNHGVINLEAKDSSFKGCVLLGDNGVGKTTILRSIAMSLSGRSSASGLADEVEGKWLKDDTKKGFIRLKLRSEKNKGLWSIETTFERENKNTDIVKSYKTKPSKLPFNELFVCGYGATRGIVGDAQYSYYSVTDAVYSLFTYDSGYLQNPELSIRRIREHSKSNKLSDEALDWIAAIAMLQKGDVYLEKGGLFAKGPWDKPMQVGALADGHQAIITLVSDLLGWVLLHDEKTIGKGLSGIVIIDEIEQHLHPKWQRKIVALLKEIFPKIQFIITTHSPLIAGNTGKLDDNVSESKLFFIGRNRQEIQIQEIEENLGELDCDQILSSEAFGHMLNTNLGVEEVLRRASVLAAKDKHTAKEKAQYKKFKTMLKDLMFPKGETYIERIAEKEHYKELGEQIENFNTILKGKNKK